MASIHQLPGGQVTLRDPESVSERRRRPVTALQMRLAGSAIGDLIASQSHLSTEEFEEASRKVLGTEDVALLDELNDALILALVESWSFPQPVTLDGLLDLPSSTYDALKTLTASFMAKLMPNFGPDPDEASPTPPSAE